MKQDQEKSYKTTKSKGSFWQRALQVLATLFFILIGLLVILILAVRSPQGQDFIVGEATNYVSNKTGAKVSIDKLFITFLGEVELEGLYLEDKGGDTLVYSKSFLADIPIWPIIQGQPIAIDGLACSGLRANVIRTDTIKGFNYQFLIDAFAPDTVDTTSADTSSSPLEISIGSIDLMDFKVNFIDAVNGLETHVNLGTFHFEGKGIDLEEMKFEVAEMALKNTDVTYIQSKSSPPSEPSASILPYLSLDELSILNVKVKYSSDADKIDTKFVIDDLHLLLTKADLALQEIQVGEFTLNNSNFQVKMGLELDAVIADSTAVPNESLPFVWPEWNVDVGSLDLKNNNIEYDLGDSFAQDQAFDPNHIVINQFNFKAKDITLSKSQAAQFNLEHLSFQEASGLELDQLSFALEIDPSKLSVDNLMLKTGNSSIQTDLRATYASLQQFIDQPEASFVSLNIINFHLDLNDAFSFLPELRRDESLNQLAKHTLSGKVKAKGTISKVDLTTLLVSWGTNTQITCKGDFLNLTNFDELSANINDFTFKTTRSDLANFVSKDDLGIDIPKNLLIQSQFKGKIDDFVANAQLRIPEGKVKIRGAFKQQNEISFNGVLEVIDLKLGEILKNPKIGDLAFTMGVQGYGNSINDLNAALKSNFSKLELNGYDFSALQLDGTLMNGGGFVTLDYRDLNLDLALDSKIHLDSVAPKIALDFNMEGADFQALGLTEKPMRAKLLMKANFKGNLDQFEFDSHISEAIAIYDGGNHSLGQVDLSAGATQDSLAMDVNSDFLNGILRANAGFEQVVNAIQGQLVHYFTDSLTPSDAAANPVKLQLDMRLSESELVSDFLVPEIRSIAPLHIMVDFDQKENKLNATVDLPFIDYDGYTVDSLQLDLNATREDATFKIGFNQLNAGQIVMDHTYFEGESQDELLKLRFHALDGDKEFYEINSEISGDSANLKFHVSPEKLVVNGKAWDIPPSNEINIGSENVIAKDFVLTNNEQRIQVANDLILTAQHNVGVGFDHFELANLLAIFNTNDLLATGDLQGSIVAVNPLTNMGLLTDFHITNLSVLETLFGKLSLNTSSINGENYSVDLDIKGADLDVMMNGEYALRETDPELDFTLEMNKIGMQTIASLSGGQLEGASGNISGKMALKGGLNSPEYKGFIQFNDASFDVRELQNTFHLTNNKILIDNDAITLRKFSVQDAQKNQFRVDGSILTKNLMNPGFDLVFDSKNFQTINSSKGDNELFYGSMNLSLDGSITGNMNFPKVDMNLKINENSNFTYIIQYGKAEIETIDGVVEFVNKKDPNNILTRNDDSANVALFGGIELRARLQIDKKAQLHVIVDPKTGDKLSVSGKGDLDFNIAKNGLTTLSGRYDINEGKYSLTLYNLVKREFALEPGGSVVWRGDPMNADLNVTAKYAIETSASALMASQISGSNETVQNQYRQKLPFLVFLNVKGTLGQPELSFNLGMPEDAHGAIDGTVYGRIEQLNTQEDELNKHVFSLLVLERFYPSPGSDGSNGGSANLVRSNINDAVSDQLNAFSGKLTKNTGIELNFGLNSYTDYQGETEQQRIDLNISAEKKLFDDRLIVAVGSNVNVEGSANSSEETPVVGNISIQYMLTEDGHLRLKGFRNSEFQNVIDGQVFVNGISLLFQREFNYFNDLFHLMTNENIENDRTIEK